MKKFLGKKAVMIIFVALAALFLAVEVGILVRPVSYGLNYTYTTEETHGGVKYSYTQKINIKSDKVARMKMESQAGDDEEKSVMDMWIYRDGHNIIVIGEKKYISVTGASKDEIAEVNRTGVMTKAEYEAEVAELKAMKKANPAEYKEYIEDEGIKFNIFRAEVGLNAEGKMEYANNVQAIVFIVVHGMFTIALITFGTLSLVFFIKNKKKA